MQRAQGGLLLSSDLSLDKDSSNDKGPDKLDNHSLSIASGSRDGSRVTVTLA